MPRYTISLRLRHPSRDLAIAGAALGLTPTRVWRAGERRSSPKGAPLDSVWDESFWTAHLLQGMSRNTGLAAAVAGVADRLSPHRDLLQGIVDGGGEAELFIGWFIPGGNGGDALGWPLLARLADLRLTLGFDVYPTR